LYKAHSLVTIPTTPIKAGWGGDKERERERNIDKEEAGKSKGKAVPITGLDRPQTVPGS